MKKLISVILLFSLLSPLLTPLATLASAGHAAPERRECSTGAGHDCMEGGICKMNHKQCKSHMAKMDMGREGRHGVAPASEKEHCDTFYSRCGTDDGARAFSANPLETPFLLTTNRLGASVAHSPLFTTATDPYAGPYHIPLERPPSITPSIHGL